MIADWLDDSPLDLAPITERMGPTRYAFAHHHPSEEPPVSAPRYCHKTDPSPPSDRVVDREVRIPILPPPPVLP